MCCHVLRIIDSLIFDCFEPTQAVRTLIFTSVVAIILEPQVVLIAYNGLERIINAYVHHLQHGY
jgi:hypothetical protein